MVELTDNDNGRAAALQEALTYFYVVWDTDTRWIAEYEGELLTDPAQFGNPPAEQAWSATVRTDGDIRAIFCQAQYKRVVLRRSDFLVLAHFNMTFDDCWRIVRGMRAHFGA